MRKEQVAIIVYSIWLILITFFTLLAQTFDVRIFFILSLIGFLIIIETIMPKYIRPGYLRYIQYILAAEIGLFVVIVAQKVLETLAR